MGLYVEATYTKYGSNWREGLFYTVWPHRNTLYQYTKGIYSQHALALFLFIPFARSITAQFNTFLNSPPLPIKSWASSYASPLSLLPSSVLHVRIPRQVFFLVLNALTQYLCIRGVNILGAVSSALTVTIVLNIRKLVSLLLSVWLFGNELHIQVLVGAAVVFGGGFLYGVESQRQNKLKKMNAARTKASGKKSQ